MYFSNYSQFKSIDNSQYVFMPEPNCIYQSTLETLILGTHVWNKFMFPMKAFGMQSFENNDLFFPLMSHDYQLQQYTLCLKLQFGQHF